MNMPAAPRSRWLIAIMGTLLQLCLGTVYAWSYFQKPLVTAYHWSHSQVAWAFSFAICALGLAAAWGGVNLPKFGPRKLAMSGGFLFGAGYLLGALALHVRSLSLLYLGYGLVGGAGLGLGYVTPVATAAKWFPDKKGFVTGMVIMGFGLGALLMSKFFAPMLLQITGGNMVQVFAWLGIIFAVLTMSVGWFLVNPPAGYTVPGFVQAEAARGTVRVDDQSGTFTEYVFNSRFLRMWAVFFCNITAGIAIISFQSPLLQDILKTAGSTLDAAGLAGMGATLIAVSSLFNGIGRFFWGGLSDRIGRVEVFRIMLATQIIAFIALILVRSPWAFSMIVCYILLCYGGGFGAMPSFVTTVFGARMMAIVYGASLTAWSAAGIAGPQMVATIKDRYPGQAAAYSFGISVGLLVIGFVITLFIHNRPFSPKASAA